MNLNKTELFKSLSTDEFQNFDPKKSEQLLGEHYAAFSGFCDYLKSGTAENGILEGSIDKLSCAIDETGVTVSIQMMDGSSREIDFKDEAKKVDLMPEK